MTGFELAERIARKVCKKKIVYSKKHNFEQTPGTIFVASDYTEAIHEIAHWVAADPRTRHWPNLGLPTPENENDDSHPGYYRMNKEECVALVLTKLIYDNFFKKNEADNRKSQYVEYMYGQCQVIAAKNNISYEQSSLEATILYNEYFLTLDLEEDT